MNLRNHGGAPQFLMRQIEGALTLAGGISVIATALLWVSVFSYRVDIYALVVSLLAGLVILTPGIAALRFGIFTRSPNLISSMEAVWIWIGWRWRRLEIGSLIAFETTGGLVISSSQLPSGYMGSPIDHAIDHRKWRSFGIPDSLPGFDSLLTNLTAARVPIRTW